MPDDLQQLHRKIEEGLEAVRRLKQLEAERKKAERPKLRLIKGGLIGVGLGVGLGWLRDYYKHAAVALVATGATVGGVVISEQPHSPGSDPPTVMKPPASVAPSTKLDTEPTVRPRPPRTSSLRTQARISPPPAAPPSTTQPTKAPTQAPTGVPTTKPTTTPTILPTVSAPAVSLPVTPTVTVTVPTADVCAINLLGIRVCLPHG